MRQVSIAALRALDDAGWEKVGWSPEGERPYHRFQETRVVDSWIHLQDIRDALLQPEDDHGPGEEIVVNRFESALPYIVGKRMKSPDGTLVQVNLSGRLARSVLIGVVDGRAVALEREHRDADARDHDTGRALLASGGGTHQCRGVSRGVGDRRPRGPRLGERLRRRARHHDLRGIRNCSCRLASPMRATTTLLDNNKIMLTVEIDDAEMDEAMDTAAKTLAKQVSVKGFRKGKVPKNVLIANIGGTSVLRSEAIRESLPDFYARAVADSLIDPIGQPDINITAGEEEGQLTFEAEVEVRPEISIKGQRELRVTIPSPVVNDSEVDAQINRYLETDAVLNPVDRPIVTGDLVTMDVHVQQIGTDTEPLDMTDFMYTVGTGSIAEGIDELIPGTEGRRRTQDERAGRRGRRRHLRTDVEAGPRASVARVDRRVGRRELRMERTPRRCARRSSCRCAAARSSRPR